MPEYDVLVIGAGQAGLAAAHALGRTGLHFTVLEAGEQPGGSWPHSYESLTLFSPAKYCALPGPPFPGDQGRYPHRDEAAAYLRRYAEHFGTSVRGGALDFLPAAAYGPDGSPARRRGVSSTVPGLSCVGQPGQTGIASGMLRGVGPDAAHVVRRVQQQLSTARPRRASVPVGGGRG